MMVRSLTVYISADSPLSTSAPHFPPRAVFPHPSIGSCLLLHLGAPKAGPMGESSWMVWTCSASVLLCCADSHPGLPLCPLCPLGTNAPADSSPLGERASLWTSLHLVPLSEAFISVVSLVFLPVPIVIVAAVVSHNLLPNPEVKSIS